MKLKEIKTKLNNLTILTKNNLKQFEPKSNNLNCNIQYWLKNKDLISLKKGVYIFSDTYKKQNNKDEFLEYIANQLTIPSYISLEYVMAKYQLITEAVTSITSITTKTTRGYNNELASYNYYTVNKKLFCGYQVNKINDISIITASKAKAVFDFLYLRFMKNMVINEKAIKNLRINWENFTKKDFKELNSYVSLTRSKKIKEVITLIRNIC